MMSIFFKTLISAIEMEYPEVKAYVSLKDFDHQLVLEIRKDGYRRFHSFFLYQEAPEEYIIKASKEFAGMAISDCNQGN